MIMLEVANTNLAITPQVACKKSICSKPVSPMSA